MGIKFECVHCGHVLHVKDYLAGKRGVCPHCQGRIEIPNTPGGPAQADDGTAIAVEVPVLVDNAPSVATALVQSSSTAGAATANIATSVRTPPPGEARSVSYDPIAEGPHLQWYVLPSGSITKYGPAPGDMMRAWINEGRISADSMIWREGWQQWRSAVSVFPQLSSLAIPGSTAVPAPNTAPQAMSTSNAVAEIPAVVLTVDDSMPAPVAQRGAARRPGARRVRDQRNLVVVLLGTLIALLLPVLIYVLMHQ
ncbi:MAG TPA: DUF4339 domain-containing protein [Pirellulales bacterium]|jgi:hypothetical protein